MKRRDVLAGAAAVAVASVIPTLPAIAMPVAKPQPTNDRTFVLFMAYGYGYAKMRVFEGDMSTKKGMVNTKTQWSKDYLIKQTADMDIPTNSKEVMATIVKRSTSWVEDLKKQAIAYDEPEDVMFRRARTMSLCEKRFGPCRLEMVTKMHPDIGEMKFFDVYDANNVFCGQYFASRAVV